FLEPRIDRLSFQGSKARITSVLPPVTIFDLPFFQKRSENLCHDATDHDAQMVVMVSGESADRKASHDATGFLEEVIHGIKTFQIEFSTKLHTVRIIRLASHCHSGGQLSIEFPGTLAVLVGKLATELDEAEVQGEGAFGEGWHGRHSYVLG